MWKFALFNEDAIHTSNTLSSAVASEDDSVDIGAFSPPEGHASAVLESTSSRLRIWTVGGHFSENPIFNVKANKVIFM